MDGQPKKPRLEEPAHRHEEPTMDSSPVSLPILQPQPPLPPLPECLGTVVADSVESTSQDVAATQRLADELPSTPSNVQTELDVLSNDIRENERERQAIMTEQNDPESSGRPVRSRRLPARFRDILPEPLPPPSHDSNDPLASEPPPTLRALPRVILHVFDSFRTSFNKFFVARDYRHRPSYDPDSVLTLDQLSNTQSTINLLSTTSPRSPSLPPPPPWPWRNMSIWRLMTWMMTGSAQKSLIEVTRVAHEIVRAPDMNPDDLEGFDARTEIRRFDKSENVLGEDLRQDSWKQSTVSILVPTREENSAGNGQPFAIPGLLHRSLTAVIRESFSRRSAKWFHLTPFKRIWKSPITGQEQRVYDELYTSDAWITAHDELQKQRRDDGCNLERVIIALMFWSDATHLAQFGTASAWPVYLFFGNQSKYTRCNPKSEACHPIAFIPSLPDSIRSFISGFIKRKTPMNDILTHCKRELFHAVWRILLDDEFIDAYQNGIVITCYDGKRRRVFPRIFTYSADYPEKVLLAAIRDKGLYPCPRCLIPKTAFHLLGLLSDISQRISKIRLYAHEKVLAARNAIYNFGSSVKGAIPEQYLKSMSLVPTFNAIQDRLGSFRFDIYHILVVDLLHEFELGIFKSVFKHLLRLLYANTNDPGLIPQLDDRFFQIASFGKGAIRRFPDNVSEARQHAARHFEDIIQCAIPAFEGLFPAEHDDVVRKLLFRLAHWHALAKLRQHTEESLDLLDEVTRSLGQQLRRFQNVTCAAFNTMELPSETSARWRRKERELNKSNSATSRIPGARSKAFNLHTYKLHALGDYVHTIRQFGTTDSYTTQIGEVSHQQIKKFYQRTNKKDPAPQIATQERRLARIRRQLDAYYINSTNGFSENDASTDSESTVPDELHHRLSDSPANAFNMAEYLQNSPDDPAFADFIPKLKDHLLSRLLNHEYDGDEHAFTDEQRSSLLFINNLNRVLRPKRLQINYTTYDMRRDQDTLHPGRGLQVAMLLSREGGPNTHPFWYAEVLGAFLITVSYSGVNRTMDFLWVRWFGVMPGYHWGFKNARLPKIGFVPLDSGAAFGFVDPALVLRACHLIPAFVDGRTDSLLRHGPSVARETGVFDDWAAYYVNIFADRDMFTRYAGIGVGHHAQYELPTLQHQDDEQHADADDQDEFPLADGNDHSEYSSDRSSPNFGAGGQMEVVPHEGLKRDHRSSVDEGEESKESDREESDTKDEGTDDETASVTDTDEDDDEDLTFSF